MAKKLNVKVLDEYSSEELTRIALECPFKKYHIEEDASYIEILDLDTHKAIQTGTGAVVGTNLLNTAVPIIRYWQGDIVTIVNDEKCSCGTNGRIIKNICGRQMDCIVSNDKTIPASAFMDLAYNWFLTNNVPIHGIRYQVVQEDKNTIKILLKKGLYDLTLRHQEDIIKSMYNLVDRNIKISIEYTENFIMQSNKFKPVIRMF